MSVIYQATLPNQLELIIEDQSNRYFGDYHRVKLRVRCPVAVSAAAFNASQDPAADAAAAERILGSEIVYEKSLERMGVAGEEFETIKQELLERFLQINRPYLARADFPARFIALKMREKQQPGRPGGPSY